MPNTSPHLVASGTIRPCRFVKIDSSNAHKGLEADANDPIIGISYEASNKPPLEDLVSTNNHAESGELIGLHGDGDICLLELGGTVSPGALLKSDGDGKGVAALTSGTTVQQIGAKALEGGDSGHKIRVQVLLDQFLPAVA